MVRALMALMAMLWILAMGVEVVNAQSFDEGLDTETLLTLDTVYEVEVTAPRPDRTAEAFAVRRGTHRPAAPVAETFTPDATISWRSWSVSRRWAWVALGAGATVVSYVWLTGKPATEPKRGTLRVTIGEMPD